ncbi:conserved hypothetical protein [Cellulomonas flavigena DSM 20109]|uniref:Uncharacterized protein n=1 Tax=Cellulomonas flavigena (strain ATCC 482 / DSM 20109 / BCRC 11376 / JCM 18109 / NBRC 3775 / NCIMB 8073 / NRS 134) TaxID=446466 RepID=D5UCQ6_CELFN|nr:hypothetical protein [Cellulomonas flavigena]ADG76291.1 conserved hypothetical protein [Cellulomonas flavigena DSM 20109]
MSAARALLRTVRAAVWRPLVVGAVVVLTMWALGMRWSSAALVALAAATVVAVVQRVDGQPEPRPAPRHHRSHDGARGEVLDLAWSMVGRDGRVGERALRRLREAGARRVARHGLDLADPDQADALRDLLGARALATLTHRTHPLPGVGDLVHALDVLERLGPTRTHPAPPQDAPEPRSPR